jgi:crotonobetainyl-CoA:carnitine CoA-transferase CaiB-like acyl-CoA transferase
MVTPPLHGLRVIETATGVSGPYAGRLLASLGAQVVKIEPAGGDPARTQQVDDVPLGEGELSPLFIHLNAGKLNTDAESIDPSWADVVLASDVLSGLRDSRWDPDRLRRHNTRLVTTTAWGSDASTPGCMADELLVQTATGFLGFNGDEGSEPLRLPGWQSQYVAGGLAAAMVQTILRTDVSHIDVSWLGALLTATELCYGDALHCQRVRTLVGAHPPTAFPSGAIKCKDGHVAPGSIRPIDWEMQCLFYGIPEWIDDPELRNRLRRQSHIPMIWEKITPWYAERSKREIFDLALGSPWAAGMVMTPLDALSDPHLDARGYLGTIVTPQAAVTGAVRPFKAPGLPVLDQRVRAVGESDTPPSSNGTPLQLRPFNELRVIEMTISWAGPYVGNVLSPLGVEVIKIESTAPFDGFRTQRPYDHGMRPGQEDLVHDNRFYEAGGLFNAVNKGKRGCVINLASDEGRSAFLELVRNSDGLVANFSAHVLPQLGLDFETLTNVNPRFVVVRMPAFGVDGPYSGAVGYGSIIEAMGGVGHRQGYEHEEARISNIYFPDPTAGIHATNALLTGLFHADTTGRGMEIDLSQHEAMWQHSGEALVLASLHGRNIGRMGNREPGVEVATFASTSDQWVAVVATGTAAGPVTQLLNGSSEMSAHDFVNQVQAVGGKAEVCWDPWTAPSERRVAPLLDVVDHPITGPMRHIASPFTLDGRRPKPIGHAPLFDQDTDEILTTIAGLDQERIVRLRGEGHIGGELPPPSELGFVYD